jgi:hypothetical protein
MSRFDFVAIGIAVLVGLYFFYRGRRHTRRLFTALARGKPQSSEPRHFFTRGRLFRSCMSG